MLVASLSAAGVSTPLQPEPLTGASGRADARESGNLVGLRQTTSRATPEDMQNFVIFSRARSGTTWLIAMLNGHPELSRVPKAQVFEQTGIQFIPINTLYQMMSLVERQSAREIFGRRQHEVGRRPANRA